MHLTLYSNQFSHSNWGTCTTCILKDVTAPSGVKNHCPRNLLWHANIIRSHCESNTNYLLIRFERHPYLKWRIRIPQLSYWDISTKPPGNQRIIYHSKLTVLHFSKGKKLICFKGFRARASFLDLAYLERSSQLLFIFGFVTCPHMRLRKHHNINLIWEILKLWDTKRVKLFQSQFFMQC